MIQFLKVISQIIQIRISDTHFLRLLSTTRMVLVVSSNDFYILNMDRGTTRAFEATIHGFKKRRV